MKSKAKLLFIMILSFVLMEAAMFAGEEKDVPRNTDLPLIQKL